MDNINELPVTDEDSCARIKSRYSEPFASAVMMMYRSIRALFPEKSVGESFVYTLTRVSDIRANLNARGVGIDKGEQ